ncbi:MAG: amidohydrolase family protein [Anaerolineae bacterium]|nr:amidohydrolase family protein [Anaerolineae bacterium]
MIIDAHTHLFSPNVITQRAQYAERDTFFGYLYASPKARTIGVVELLTAMDASGVDRAVVAGWAWQNHDVCVEQNTWLIEIARQHRARLSVLCTVQPNAGDAAIRELRRCVESGLVGVGELNADGQGFRLDDAAFLQLARAASEMGVPLMLHTNEPVGHLYPGKGRLSLAEIYAFVRQVPDLHLVLAHWGGGYPFYELMPEVRAASQNVFYDTAASPLLYAPDVFRVVVNLVGADKVLFGSDYPLILYPRRQKEPDMRPFLDEVRAVGLSDEEQRKILGENAARVFGL